MVECTQSVITVKLKIFYVLHVLFTISQCVLLRYHPPSSTLLALIGASAFAFNKYPHKPYIF